MPPIHLRAPVAVGLLRPLVGVRFPLGSLYFEAGGLLVSVVTARLGVVATCPGIVAVRPVVVAARPSIVAVIAIFWLPSSPGLDQERRHVVLVDGGGHLAGGDLGAAVTSKRESGGCESWLLLLACDSVSWRRLRRSGVSWHWCTTAAVPPA